MCARADEELGEEEAAAGGEGADDLNARAGGVGEGAAEVEDGAEAEGAAEGGEPPDEKAARTELLMIVGKRELLDACNAVDQLVCQELLHGVTAE